LTAAGGSAAAVWGSTSAAIPTARPTSQGPAAEPLGRVPSQKSPTTTRARPGARAVPEMLFICRTERHCAGDRSPKRRTVHGPDRGKCRSGWPTGADRTNGAAIYPAPFWLRMLSGSIVITRRLAPGNSRTSAPYFGVMNASAHAHPSSDSVRAVPRTSSSGTDRLDRRSAG